MALNYSPIGDPIANFVATLAKQLTSVRGRPRRRLRLRLKAQEGK